MEKDLDIGSVAHLINYMKDELELVDVEPMTYSPLVLAYIGDGIYELLIRTKVINQGSMQVNKMHKASANLVKAETQAKLIQSIMEELSEEEMQIYKRGRNAKSSSTAKNAKMIDYRMATGCEALMGYLYLKNEYQRLIHLLHLGMKRIGVLS